MNRMKSVAHIFTAIVIGVAVSLTAFAQNGSFAGKYEGTIKDDTGEQKLTLELTENSGKYSGTLTTGRGSFKILKGQMADGTLTLEIEKAGGSSGSMAFKKSGDELIATFTEAGKNVTVNFRKATSDEISGDWDAVADAQGQPFPFTLSLKLDGDKVTGSSDSQLGHGTITTGTWKEGKLAVVLDGNITLVATMIEGKLSGDYDFAGQSSGKWVAVKKK
ncbi:MAG TPA: hypothetical protein VNG71_05085 [Pyrinomonadaceae bacterium]|nr:hypothetical protein [Pyrinomonadaceae bacterium]